MNIDYLQEFLVLANTLNYTEASRQLNMSQSSLSRHVADLEQEIGVRLLDRNRQRVALTAEGEAALEDMALICRTYTHLIETFSSLSRRSHDLVVGGHTEDIVTLTKLLGAISDLRADLPDAHVRIAAGEGSSFELCHRDLMTGNLDCVLLQASARGLLERYEELEAVRVGGLACCLLLSVQHPLARKHEVTLHDLNGKTLIQLVGQKFQQSWVSLEAQLVHRGISFNTRPVGIATYLDVFNIDFDDSILIFPLGDAATFATLPSSIAVKQFAAADRFVLPYNLVFRKNDNRKLLTLFIAKVREHFTQA